MKLRVYAIILLTVTATVVQAQPDKLQELPAPPTPPREPLKPLPALPGKPPKPPKAPKPPSPPSEPVESLDRDFFAPELLMKHQKAIGLSTDQETAIRAEIQKMMAQFTDLQWQQSAETESLHALARQDHPDEKEVLSQLDKLLDIENQIKRLHTGMLVRIKDVLTVEQQAQLRELARNGGPHPRALREKETR